MPCLKVPLYLQLQGLSLLWSLFHGCFMDDSQPHYHSAGKKKKITGDEFLCSRSNLGITRRLECGWLLLENARQRDDWPWCGVMTPHLRRLFIKGQVVRWRQARLTKAAAMCPSCSVNTNDASSLFYDLKGASSGFSTKASWAIN